MKRFTFLGILCFLSFTSYSQNLTFEPVISLRTMQSESTFISVEDTLFAFENNKGNSALSLGVKLNYKLSPRVSLSTGIEYFSESISYVIFNDEVCDFCPVQKGWGTHAGTFVFPQHFNLQLYKHKNWELYGIIGLTPVVNLKRKEPTVKSDNRYLSQGVADVMNSLPTTIKPVYLDYNIGLQLKYRRINGYFLYQDNVSNSTAAPLAIYNKLYPFTRNNQSMIFSLGYDLFNIRSNQNSD